jgi:type IV pilus assembly protein PilC
MINAGVAIVRCLAILQEQVTNPNMKNALRSVSMEVQQGNNLADSMRKHPKCFDELYVSMVEAGESGGVLDEVLNRLAKLLEDMTKLQNQVKSALAYPTAVLVIAILAFFGMTIFLIPIFAKIFVQIHATLPPLTQFMLFLSGVLRSWLVIIPILAIIGISFLLRNYYRTYMGRRQIDGFMLKMPLFGEMNEKSAVARFSRVLGTLLKSGVPVLQAIDIVCKTIGNQVIVDAIQTAKYDIQQGGQMSLAIQKAKVFPPMAIQMIGIGEETGELDGMLMKVADFYEDEVAQAVKALTSVIEPLMMVLVAVIVGSILLSMYLPLFSVFDKLG